MINDATETEPSIDLTRNYTELRLMEIVNKFNAFSFVFYAQTYFGIPIWMKGICVDITLNLLTVYRSTNSISYDTIYIETPTQDELENYNNIDADGLAQLLNYDNSENININNSSTVNVYQYKSSDRINANIAELITRRT